MSEESVEIPIDYVDAVHQLAQMVPPGSVLSYKDVAELLGSGGARQAGKAMGRAPTGTPWWRIIRSNGSIAPELEAVARTHWEREAIAAPDRKVSMNAKRWIPTAAQWEKIDRLRLALGNAEMWEAGDQL
ncbi:MGMT family protein [Glutamicibacter sp.]|uniref:MGMT family protein n=1 Tax=Glutamicibacter sp. TaxID=1931995 RepID=UPI0028BF3332|nr:MGMT family protein [Glutamicibacter sp.]